MKTNWNRDQIDRQHNSQFAFLLYAFFFFFCCMIVPTKSRYTRDRRTLLAPDTPPQMSSVLSHKNKQTKKKKTSSFYVQTSSTFSAYLVNRKEKKKKGKILQSKHWPQCIQLMKMRVHCRKFLWFLITRFCVWFQAFLCFFSPFLKKKKKWNNLN